MADPDVMRAGGRRSAMALAYGVPIGMLGGLIGLGGAEFRLPVLAGPLKYRACQAVALYLAVTLATVTAVLGTRGGALPLDSFARRIPAMSALIGGSVIGASFGPALGGRWSDRHLDRVVFVLLVGLGCGLMLDSVLIHEPVRLIDRSAPSRVGAGFFFGAVIRLISGQLGVAGGEPLIPTLIFAFGWDMQTAGTASLLISMPMVVIGLIGHARQGSFTDRRAWGETVLPMNVGSMLGAVMGGLLVNAVSLSMLKTLLGVILIISAWKVFLKERPYERAIGREGARS
ncbi:MAG: sulfite exporter TauE/SafE family protein [Nitrospirota bacterium]